MSWYGPTGKEPDWRHPLFFIPFFLVASAWVPASVAVLVMPESGLWVRAVAGVFLGAGLAILVAMVRWYRGGRA